MNNNEEKNNSIQSENKVEGITNSLGMDDSKKLDQVFLNL